MKKVLAILMAATMAASLAACAAPTAPAAAQESKPEAKAEDEQLVAGAVWYNFADTFITTARTALEKDSAEDGAIKVISADSQGDIAIQTNNLNNFYTQGVDYVVLNNINTNAKPEIINQAKEHGATLIFVNTDSPTEDEFKLYDKVYHISAASEKSGVIMGEQMLEYWNSHPEADRNGNGKLDYVMLLGLQQHYDTQVRAKYSIETVEAAGVETNCVQEALCNYQRAEAQNQMASILQARKDDIDGVFACNDDMALGAIEALKAAGFFTDESTFIPVVSVDATAVGVEAVKEGTLLGTCLNNPITLADATYKVMKLLAEGKELTQENVDIENTRVEGHHVYIDFVPINADNPEDAAY